MDSSLFISYSHTDTAWMKVFKRHLEGMLRGRCKVWTDEEIPPGVTWLQALEGNLHDARAALVLASPDYLTSEWCRRELAALSDAQSRGKLGALYWVLLRPCGWQWSDLAHLQAVQEPASRALEAGDDAAREEQALRCCDRIATGVTQAATADRGEIALVRRVLREARLDNGDVLDVEIAPQAEIIKGDFSMVCRGLRRNGDDVFIKVLTNTPLHMMRKMFKTVSQQCGGIVHPSVIRTLQVAQAGSDDQARIVILSDMARGVPLSEVMKADRDKPMGERELNIDTVRIILLRLAEALQALHDQGEIEWPADAGADTGTCYTHLMGPLVPSNIFYHAATERPQVSLVGVTNFLWHFFEPETFVSIVRPKHGIYRLPKKVDSAAVDARADQYFLGMLALELLEARPLFEAGAGQKVAEPLDILRGESAQRWAGRHQQLNELLKTLLAEDPKARFKSMAEVITELRGLEEASRALAKYAYNTFVSPPAEGGANADVHRFAARFYENLLLDRGDLRAKFEAAQIKRQGDVSQLPDAEQRRKLSEALTLVLNFRCGSSPSAVSSVSSGHAQYALTDADFQHFEDSFMKTLRAFLPTDEAAKVEVEAILKAWRDLFKPVMAEMGKPPPLAA